MDGTVRRVDHQDLDTPKCEGTEPMSVDHAVGQFGFIDEVFLAERVLEFLRGRSGDTALVVAQSVRLAAIDALLDDVDGAGRRSSMPRPRSR